MSRTGAEIVGVTYRPKQSPYGYDRFQAWITNPPGTLPRLRTRMFDTQEEAIAWRNAQALPLRIDAAFQVAFRARFAENLHRMEREVLLFGDSQKLSRHLADWIREESFRQSRPASEPGEEWRWIPGEEGKYQISTHGRVWSQPRSRSKQGGLLALVENQGGYAVVRFGNSRSKSNRTRAVHTLVLITFIGPKPPGQLARHRDGDRRNNRVENLRWGTPKENIRDRIWHDWCRRANHPRSMYVRLDEPS